MMKWLKLGMLLCVFLAVSPVVIAQEGNGGGGFVALCTTNCDGGNGSPGYVKRCTFYWDRGVRMCKCTITTLDGFTYDTTYPCPR